MHLQNLTNYRLLVPAALVCAALTGCQSTAAPTTQIEGVTTITVIGYGDAFEKAITTSVVDPFNKSQDKIYVEYKGFPTAADMLSTLRTEKANPTSDVAILDYSVSLTGNAEGIFDKIDPAAIPNLQELVPMAPSPEGFGPRFTLDNLSILYNKDTEKPPTSFADLAAPRYKGHVAIDGAPDIRSLGLIAILAKGNLAETSGAFETFKSIAANVETWKPNPEVNQYIIANPGSVGVGWNARAQVFSESSPEALGVVKIAEEGSIIQSNSINLVAGADKEAAEEFMNYALSKEAQAQFATAIPYGPVNAKAELAPDAAQKVAEQGDSIIDVDWAEITQSREALTEKWRREVQGG